MGNVTTTNRYNIMFLAVGWCCPHANCTGNQKANIQQMHPTESLRRVEAKLKCSVLAKTDSRVIIVCVSGCVSKNISESNARTVTLKNEVGQLVIRDGYSQRRHGTNI